MKKIFAVLTIAGMFFFFGCGSAQKESAEQVEAVEEVVEEAAEEVEDDVDEVEDQVEEVLD